VDVYKTKEKTFIPVLCGVCGKPFNDEEGICVELIHIGPVDLRAVCFFHARCAGEFYLKSPNKRQKEGAE